MQIRRTELFESDYEEKNPKRRRKESRKDRLEKPKAAKTVFAYQQR